MGAPLQSPSVKDLDRPNVMYRTIVTKLPKDMEAVSLPSDFMEGVIGNNMLDNVNTEKSTPVYQKLIRPQAGDFPLEPIASLKKRSTYHAFTIPLKDRKMKYENGTTFPKEQRDTYRICVITYDAYGTATTDNICFLCH